MRSLLLLAANIVVWSLVFYSWQFFMSEKELTPCEKKVILMEDSVSYYRDKYRKLDSLYRDHLSTCAFISKERIKMSKGNYLVLKHETQK